MPIRLSPDDLRRHPQLAAKINEALGEPDTAPDPPVPPQRPSNPPDTRRARVQGNPRGNRRGNPPRRRWPGWAALPLALAMVAAGWYGANWAAAAVGLTAPRAPEAAQDNAVNTSPGPAGQQPGSAGKATKTPETPVPITQPRASAAPEPAVLAAVLATEPPIRVLVNGQPLQFDVPPQIVNGRTLAPMRAIFQALGAEVAWDGQTQTVTAKRGHANITLPVGSQVVTVNGRWIRLDIPATIIDGRTLIPLRFVSEALGAEVVWDDATRTITITEPLAAAQRRCFTLGEIDSRGTYIGEQCGPVSDTPGMAIPAAKDIIPDANKCSKGIAVASWCAFYQGTTRDRNDRYRTWAEAVRTRNGDAGDGRFWVWYASGDLFRCTTADCSFAFRTLDPDWWHMTELFQASALVWAREQCAPPLTGEFTSVLTGRRIGMDVAIRGPNGKLSRIPAILDTGGVTTAFPDEFLRRAGYTPYLSGAVGGVGGGTSKTYSYRIPRPLIRVGDTWAPTGEGTMTVKGIVGFDGVLLSPDLMVGDGITLRTEGSRWSLSFPCKM